MLKQNNKLITALTLLVVASITLTLFAYSPCLFNFFAGDDFVHLTWLSQAIHHPELIWKNFYSSWLDGSTTKFYRPLISIFMVSDYLLYGNNGLGFHITNLGFHIASSIFCFSIIKNIDKKLDNNSSNFFFPFFAATLFALYPLHSEAVSWITGRVDAIVTCFCLASFYLYILWRKNKTTIHFILALFTFSLALMSKEMAITLPAVFVLYEIIYNFSLQNKLNTLKNCIATVPFWLLLGVYFVIRLYSLGTFVGGYDNSLFFIANKNEFIQGWIHALGVLVVPVNKTLIGSHHILYRTWILTLIGTSILSLVNIGTNKNSLRHFVFFLSWFILCLAPVYKLFNISDDLQGSRLAYLATVPLCFIFSLAWSSNKLFLNSKTYSFLVSACLTGFLLSASSLLYMNNLAWQKAGMESNKIRFALEKLYREIPGDPTVLLLGLPDQINGAYTCRNALDGMTKYPQLSRHIINCLMVNAFEPIFPFGFLKDSIAANYKNIYVYQWQAQKEIFEKINLLTTLESNIKSSWDTEELKNIIDVPSQQQCPPKIEFNSKQTLAIETGRKPGFIEFKFSPRPSWNLDFVELNTVEQNITQKNNLGLDLLYCNENNPDFELRRRTHSLGNIFSTKSNEFSNRYIFALRSLPEWSFGGNCHKLRLLIPANTKLHIKSLSFLNAKNIMPEISFLNSGYFGTKGYLHISNKQTDNALKIDISSIKNAENMSIEISRANLLFEEQNPQKTSKVSLSNKIYTGKTNTLELNSSDFGDPGIYELRAWALDKSNNIVGCASDHIVLSVLANKN